MGKKQNRPPASKTASAASPAVSGLTNTGNKSSILRAAFSPSEYQLALFASVIQGLDAQHVRVHDTITGKLQCDHPLAPKESVTSLDWGYFAGQKEQSKKKRKRHSDVNGVGGLDQGDVVIAFGTNKSDIRMFSPSIDKIVGTLSGAHDKGIKNFKFTAGRPGQEGWSIGDDNKLVQWDLRSSQSTRIINLTASSFTTLSPPLPSNPPLICASQAPQIIDIESPNETRSFPAMRNPIHTVLSSSTESVAEGLFLASDGDRYINVFDPQTQRLVMNLVAETEVSSLSLYGGPDRNNGALEKQVLAAVTDDGTVEFFTKPLFQPGNQQGSKGASLKAKSKQMTRRADATLRLTRSETSDALVPVVNAAFQGSDLIIAWVEGGVLPVFERIRWLNEDTDELLFTGTKSVPKTKSSSAFGGVTTNGTKTATETQVDESKAVVEQGNYADEDVEMQDSREDDVSSEDSDDDKPNQTDGKGSRNEPGRDVEMQNGAESNMDEEEEGGEPTFGDLMRANANEVDVEAELEDDNRMGPLVPGKPNTAVQQIPTGVSLSTVLTQSLKTNDSAMLESCFHTNDLSIIRTTIQRLESSLAATLLQKLAERLSSRPSRYGHLLVWVQWTCVAHGGALAGKPDLLKRMATLFKVMDQRSSSLPSLLQLKGKLDMLDAQLGLRQSLRTADGMDSEDEDNVIYVEGQDEEDSDAEAEADLKNASEATPRSKSIREQAFDEDESMVNGVQASDNDEDSDEEEDAENENEDENVFDVEAEESAGSSDAEESDEDDENEGDDEDSAGSMVDFVADSEDDGNDSDGVSAQPPSKKTKESGGKAKNKASGRK